MTYLILFALSCAPAEMPAEVESRLVALEQANSAGEVRIRGLEARLQALEVAAPPTILDAPPPAVDPTVSPSSVKVGPGGVIVTDLSSADRLKCVYRAVDGLVTAETAYNAAFDEFSDDPKQVGFALDSPCDEQVALRVEFIDQHEIRIVALLVRGQDRGRRFTHVLGPKQRGPTREEGRLDEARLQVFLSHPRRTGLRGGP